MDIELECALLEQEHRTFHIFHNVIVKRPKWDKDDPRRAAAIKPLLYLLLSPGSAVATGASIVAIVTLFLSFQTHQEFIKQNKELVKQNDYLKKQIELQDTQWQDINKLNLYTLLYDGEECPDSFTGICPANNIKIRVNAIKPLIHIERKAGRKDFANINLRGANISEFDFSDLNLSNSDFENSKLDKTIFVRANLKESNFINAQMQGSKLTSADLRWANFTNADLGGANVKGANFYGADLSGAIVSQTKGLTAEQLCDAESIENIRNLSPALIKSIRNMKYCKHINNDS